MVNYLDFGQQKYNAPSLVRQSKYMRVGGSAVRSPTELNLSDLYSPKKIYSPLPQNLTQPPQIAPVLPNQPSDALGVTQTPQLEPYIEQGGWQKWNTLEGNEIWMPSVRSDGSTIQEGDIYTSTSGKKYRWDSSLKTWVQLKRVADPDTGIVKWVIDDLDQPFIGLDRLGDKLGSTVWYESLGRTQQDIDTAETAYNDAQSNYDYYKNAYDTAVSQKSDLESQLQAKINEGNAAIIEWSNTPIWKVEKRRKLKAKMDRIKAEVNTLKQQIKDKENEITDAKSAMTDAEGQLNDAKEAYDAAKEAGTLPEPIGGEQLSDITDWQSKLEGTLDKFRRGELTTDTSQLREGDWTEKWLADVLDNAKKTGLIVNDFTDAEGNLTPELQGIVDSYNENIAQAHEETMKNLRLAALQRGHSANDLYYNEALSNWQAGASMEIANNLSDLLVNEMQSSYQFMTNALADALKTSGRATEAEMLQNEMSNQWAQALDDYRQQIDALAQEMADTESASQGQIVTSIIALIMSILGNVIGGGG